MNKKNNISTNVVWRMLERFSAKIVTFLVSLVLARLLDPAAYGTIALVTVFTTILEVFIDSGLGNALIQKKDADNIDFSTVFYFNMVMCSVLSSVMFFMAPYIADFYGNDELVAIIRVLSLTLIISGAKNIIHSYIFKNMQFRKFFFATLIGTCVSAVVGLTMAFMGFGVWALVAQPLVNYIIDTVILWINVDWRPERTFSFSRFKVLFSYGWKILVAKLVNVTYVKSRDMIIGKMYSSEDLAYFNRGDAFPSMIVPNITASVDGVLFPAMANEQEDKKRIKELVKKSTQVSSYLIIPAMVGLIACGEPLIRVLLTEKWISCVPYMNMFCLVYAFYPFSISNLNAIRALGHSKIILKLEIIERIFSIILLLMTIKMGVFWIGISYLIGELFSTVLCALPCKKLINYGFVQQIIDLLPLIFISSIMGLLVYMIQYLGFSDLVTLMIQVPLGVAVFLILSWIFKIYGFNFFINILKRKLAKSHD